MSNQQDIKVRMGKYVSMLLRHHPEEAGVILDENGWTDVADLIDKVNPRYPLTEELLHELAFGIDKQRYEFSEDGKRVRAVHGHSVSVDLGYDESEPPSVLYHGTAEKFLESIEEQGLIKKERQFVHLSECIDQAKDVGRRHGKLVLYKVDAERMYKEGHVFYRSTSGVWLTDRVLPQYLIRIDPKRTKRIICRNCKTEYEIPLSANFMYFCQNCNEYIGAECEYGFAAIVPCEIYLGGKLLGRMTGGADNYRLECRELDINVKLTEKYKDLAVYREAQDIILAKLNNSRMDNT